MHRWHDVQPSQPPQHLLFPAQPGYRVCAVDVQPCVRPGLFEDDLRTSRNMLAQVKTPAIGEVQRALDPVGQVPHRHTVSGRQVRLEECWQAHPFRNPETRAPAVRH